MLLNEKNIDMLYKAYSMRTVDDAVKFIKILTNDIYTNGIYQIPNYSEKLQVSSYIDGYGEEIQEIKEV